MFPNTEHFKPYEYSFYKIDPFLLFALEQIRIDFKKKIFITSTIRSITEHIKIYKERYGSEWEKYITWESGHLPSKVYYETINATLPEVKAVDFTFEDKYLPFKEKGQIQSSITNSLMKLKPFFPNNFTNDGIPKDGIPKVGLGIGEDFVHLDVLGIRDSMTTFYYDKH